LNKVGFSEFGGVNANDQQERLMRRLQQMGMVESPESVNGEFYQDGYGRRKGHSADSKYTITVTLSANEPVLGYTTVQHPLVPKRRCPVLVTNKNIYTKNYVIDPSATSSATIDTKILRQRGFGSQAVAFTLEYTASSVSFAEIANHLFIATGNRNRIHVLQAATYSPTNISVDNNVAVNDDFFASTFEYTVNATNTSTSRYRVATTNGLRHDDVLKLYSASNDLKTVIVNDIFTSSSFSVVGGAGGGDTGTASTGQYFKHWGQFLEVVRGIENTASSDNTPYTGNIGVGQDVLLGLHSRLIYGNKGEAVLEYTPPYNTTFSGVWDVSAGGFFIAPAAVQALARFVPEGGGDMNEHIYMFTDNGVASRPGMSDFDEVIVNNGASIVLNNNCVTQIENWLVYLTRDKQLRGVNGRMDIDLGRRLKNKDGTSGPLDAMDVATSATTAFLFYDAKKKKLYAHFSSATGLLNDRQVVLDFDLGEPIVGEPLESYETRVRCLDWRVDSPTANEGFIYMTNIGDDAIGVRQNGTLWKINDGDTDFTAGTIQWSWYTPQLTLGDPTRNKTWMNTRVATMNQGSHSAVLSKRTNRQSTTTDLLTFEQSAVDGIVMRSAQLDEDKFAMQIGIRNENAVASEPTILTGVSVEYSVDAQEW
jgi:hypothetical protein